MSPRPFRNKVQALRYLDAHGSQFIANVVLTRGGPNCTTRLKALAVLVLNGHDVRFAQFSMDDVLVDGELATWTEILVLADQLTGRRRVA